MHYMFVITSSNNTDGQIFQFFISPYDQTVTLLYNSTLTQTNERAIDLAFKGNQLFTIWQKSDSSSMSIRTYSITFPEFKEINEIEHSTLIANTFNTNHSNIELNSSDFETLFKKIPY